MSIATGVAFEVSHLFLDMAPYLVLGMFMAGLLHVTINKNFIAGHIGPYSLWSVIKSSLFGIPLPLCSCGVVPTSVYLKDSGASRPAVISFLISTPQTGVDSVIAAYGLLGPAMAIIRPIAALFTGVLGGTASLLLQPKEDSTISEEDTDCRQDENSHSCECSSETCTSVQSKADTKEHENWMEKLKSKTAALFSYGFIEFTDDIVIPFIVGLLIAGILSYSIPDDFFAGSIAGSGIVGMLIMIAIGIPFYICSTSSIPIAVALILKGISPGAAFVFLMVGPATNIATLGILKKQFGLFTAMIYLGSISGGALVFGFLIDFLTNYTGINFFNPAVISNPAAISEMGVGVGIEITGILQIIISSGFLLLLLYSLVKKLRNVKKIAIKNSV
ncbi:MAG: SO_0444 family Cu/Zn efflux transporter [Spirochaetales bacterium]|nr:SO_0444 family Cu/Zn efflux transporter [Spirochaetales bacterium]